MPALVIPLGDRYVYMFICLNVSILVTCDASDIAEYDRRTPELAV